MAIRAKKNLPKASLATLLLALYASLFFVESAFMDRLCMRTISRLSVFSHGRFQRQIMTWVICPNRKQNDARQKVPNRYPAMGTGNIR